MRAVPTIISGHRFGRLSVLATLHLFFLLQASLVSGGYVRFQRCDVASTKAPQFVPLSLRGYIDTSVNPSILTLGILGSFEGANETCENVNGSSADMIVDVRAFGNAVGRQTGHNASCPTVFGLEPYRKGNIHAYTQYWAAYEIGTQTFRTLSTKVLLELNATEIGCITAKITPSLGALALAALRYVPVAILLFVGLAGLITRTCSIRSSPISDESVRVSRDPAEAFIPGIDSCLQYIQFIVLTGCLTLAYPGFFQPAVSQSAWSSLMFTSGPISHSFKYPSFGDGMYQTNSSYGFELMAQTLGSTTMSELWGDVLINLMLLMIATAILIQVSSYWNDTQQEKDGTWLARVKHAGWNVLRVALNYFLLPLVAFTCYQLFIAKIFPGYRAALAACTVVFLGLSIFLLLRYLTATGDRRDTFFNDFSGSENFTSTSWISHFLYCLPFVRGIAIGGLQAYETMQLVVLGACEAFLLAWIIIQYIRAPGSVRASRSTLLVFIRLVLVCLNVAFLPSLNLSETTKGYVGYSILAIHSLVLVFGFFFVSLVKLVKLGLSGGKVPDRDDTESAPVYNLYQLSRRGNRSGTFSRPTTSFAMPLNNEGSSLHDYLKVPQPLLRDSKVLDFSIDTSYHHLSPDPPRNEPEASTSFYRPPRARSITPNSREPPKLDVGSSSNGESCSGSSSPEQSHSSGAWDCEGSDTSGSETAFARPSDVDYSVREADQYYGRRNQSQNQRQSMRPDFQMQTSRRGLLSFAKNAWNGWTQKEKGFSVNRQPNGDF